MVGILDLFAGCGPLAKVKLVVLGSAGGPMDSFRSLNIEHVSPARLKRPGISRAAGDEAAPFSTVAASDPAAERRGPDAAASEAATTARMRRWFFARKPDAGFLLMDFPATLLQAKVFDEWLDARREDLSGVLAGAGAPEPVVQHYRSLGLMIEPAKWMSSGNPATVAGAGEKSE